MVWEYTQNDRNLAGHCELALATNFASGTDGTVLPPPTSPIPPGTSLTGRLDSSRARIEFQFPPKIVTDSRKAQWREENKPGVEPTWAFEKSGAREITMKWTYVVDSLEATNFSNWTIGRITANIRTLRGYYTQVRASGSNHRNLVVNVRLYGGVGGTPGLQDQMTCLIKGIDVKYGDTIVMPRNAENISGDPNQAFFLRSDVSIDLRIWTQGVGEGSDDPLQKIDALVAQLEPSWY